MKPSFLFDIKKLMLYTLIIKIYKVIYLSDMENSLNHLLVKMFNDILKIEEQVLINEEYKDISITDMHIIETIGYENSRNMTSVANDLGITVGTLTIAINNLVKKDYVKRTRSQKDRRVVLICLSPNGQKAYKHHEKFHSNMIEEIKSQINDEEERVLIKVLNEINSYFKKNYLNK